MKPPKLIKIIDRGWNSHFILLNDKSIQYVAIDIWISVLSGIIFSIIIGSFLHSFLIMTISIIVIAAIMIKMILVDCETYEVYDMLCKYITNPKMLIGHVEYHKSPEDLYELFKKYNLIKGENE